MKNLQKGFVVPLLIIIIAVLAIGGGVYYYSRKASVGGNSVVQTPSVNQDQSVQNVSSDQSATSSVRLNVSPAWHAALVGGQLSETDKSSIVSASMKMIGVVNSGDVATFRKYAAALIPSQQLAKLQSTPDQQVLALMELIGPLMSKEVTPDILVSSEAVWTIQDANHVQIKIQTSANSSVTMQAIRENGVWY
jgi:hypothetical protein